MSSATAAREASFLRVTQKTSQYLHGSLYLSNSLEERKVLSFMTCDFPFAWQMCFLHADIRSKVVLYSNSRVCRIMSCEDFLHPACPSIICILKREIQNFWHKRMASKARAFVLYYKLEVIMDMITFMSDNITFLFPASGPDAWGRRGDIPICYLARPSRERNKGRQAAQDQMGY